LIFRTLFQLCVSFVTPVNSSSLLPLFHFSSLFCFSSESEVGMHCVLTGLGVQGFHNAQGTAYLIILSLNINIHYQSSDHTFTPSTAQKLL
jgi:hypothetical protein